MYPEWHTVVVGDSLTPSNWSLPNVTFLSAEIQDKLGYRIKKYLPDSHYARKNIGYLFAIANGARFIYDTDEDSAFLSTELSEKFELRPGPHSLDLVGTQSLVINPYALFGESEGNYLYDLPVAKAL